MKKNNLFVFLILSVFTITSSCKKQQSGVAGTDPEKLGMAKDNNLENKLFFAKTLAKALEKEPALRVFIKNESLKKFDKDYDVFYQMVKDNQIDNETFEQKILKYSSSQDSFMNSINSLPLLTILVPELPEFDANRWNTNTEIPAVAVAPKNGANKEKVIAFYASNGMFEIPVGLLPSFPTVVVKENERIITGNSIRLKGGVDKTVFLNKNGNTFLFADAEFNGIDGKQISNESSKDLKLDEIRLKSPPTRSDLDAITNRQVPLSSVQHIVDALKSGTAWPRDNIYYGLNPSTGTTTGVLKRNVKECLTAFRFYDGEASYNQIGQNPGDPHPVEEGPIYEDWTSGQYEFRMTVLINAKNGPGAEALKTILVSPSQLFNLRYDKIQRPAYDRNNPYHGPGTYFWKPTVTTAKLYTLPVPIPIDNWDLQNISFGWKVYFSRFNLQQTITQTESQASEYATNFEMSIGFGDIVKVGEKFGASKKETNTQTHTFSKVVGPLDLGTDNLYFDNLIWKGYQIIGDKVIYNPYELSLGTVYLTIEPRIQ